MMIFRHEVFEKVCLNIMKYRHAVFCFAPIIIWSVVVRSADMLEANAGSPGMQSSPTASGAAGTASAGAAAEAAADPDGEDSFDGQDTQSVHAH